MPASPGLLLDSVHRRLACPPRLCCRHHRDDQRKNHTGDHNNGLRADCRNNRHFCNPVLLYSRHWFFRQLRKRILWTPPLKRPPLLRIRSPDSPRIRTHDNGLRIAQDPRSEATPPCVPASESAWATRQHTPSRLRMRPNQPLQSPEPRENIIHSLSIDRQALRPILFQGILKIIRPRNRLPLEVEKPAHPATGQADRHIHPPHPATILLTGRDLQLASLGAHFAVSACSVKFQLIPAGAHPPLVFIIAPECRRRDSNPHTPFGIRDFKSLASAISPRRLYRVKLSENRLYEQKTLREL